MAPIQPGQVPPEQERKILQFLNSASSAEEIASGVELPGEPDIGLALARRIIEKREQEGGRLTSLEQLLEIPYIGPERFSDLVHALAPELMGTVPENMDLQKLAARIEALRNEVAALSAQAGPGRRLTILPDRNRIYLGQPVLLRAKLTETGSGSPMAGYPVTFFTQWGKLRPVTGIDTGGRSSITVFTGIDGTARAILYAATIEPLTIDQENALLTALDRLPSDAPAPKAARDALEIMALTYGNQAGRMLRHAVDILLRQFHPDPWNTVNPHTFPDEWTVEQAAVIAMMQGGVPETPIGTVTGDSSVQVSAVCTISIIDWIPAWLEVFADMQENKWDLSSRLSSVKELAGGMYAPASIINCHIHDMVSLQRGLAGEYAGKRCIEKAATSFIQNDLSSMPEDMRLSLYAGLSAAARSVSVSGIKGWQSMVQQQQAMELNLSSMVAGKVDAGAMDRLRDELRTEVNSRVSGVEETLQETLDEKFGTLSEEIASISQTMEQMVSKTELGNVKTELQAEINTRASRQELNQVAAQVDEVSAEMDQRFQNTVTVEQLAQTEARLNEAIGTRASVAVVKDLDTRLNKIDSATTTIRTEINRLDTDVQKLKTRRTGRPN